MRVIWFVLTTGSRREEVPPDLGCSGRTAYRRLRAWAEAGIWDRLTVPKTVIHLGNTGY